MLGRDLVLCGTVAAVLSPPSRTDAPAGMAMPAAGGER